MTVYLTEETIANINRDVIARYSPNETHRVLSPSALNMIVNLPEQYVFGRQLYPTIFDKAIILFSQLVKKHIFENGNKRTAFACLTVFLRLNGYRLKVSTQEAVDFTVEVAVAPLSDAQLLKYKKWLVDHTVTE